MRVLRAAAIGVLVVLVVCLQLGPFSELALGGVVPDLALLVVVAAAIARGPSYASLLGFVAGLALDVAPPADHTMGRWALALALVGYLAGQVRDDADHSAVAAALAVAASAFIGTSVFALSGLVVQDPGVDVDTILTVIPLAVLYDLALTPLVVPPALALFARTQPLAVRW
jgi:rod shape-determining protein MreD